ncbi:hypothetical protein SMC26_06175 [Actinomadura fulvescens]|uniref:Uncharacterized protein n=1 Tax=Actinomadura fulvescens TaxID=46160 RepID=A0ABN3PN21_9ACTN
MSGEASGEHEAGGAPAGEAAPGAPQSAGAGLPGLEPPGNESVAPEGTEEAPEPVQSGERPYVTPPFRPGPPPEPTGDARVDAALAPLGELGGTQVADHVEVFEEIHQRLQELLLSADEEEAVPRPPGLPGPGSVPPDGFGR